MKDELHDEMIDRAVKVAAMGLARKSSGSTQVHNMINILQNMRNDTGIKKLKLYIARQLGRDDPTLRKRASKNLNDDIEWIQSQSNGDAADGVIEYFTYLSWAIDGITIIDKNKRSNVKNLNDLVSNL